jgi:hypothetical protein
MTRLRTAVVTLLLFSFIGLQPATVSAGDRDDRRPRRDRYEDRWERRDDRKDRKKIRKARQKARKRYEARHGSWDPARYYRHDPRRYPPRRLGRHDRIYRGSDNRYYCKRDDGTTGLIVGGITGGVLGHVIAPGGSKTLGTILGAGAGALIGRAIDDGDIVCR